MADHISDDVLRRAAEGDIAAFEILYREYAPFVYNVAYRVVGSVEDAEEIVQEVFLTVHQKLKDFMFRSSIKTWLYRITVNSSITLYQKRKKEQVKHVDIDEVEEVAGPSELHEEINRRAAQQQVEKVLNVLSQDERVCVVLRNIQGLSYQEIAQTLEININTVRTRLKRAREKMIDKGKTVLQGEDVK